MALLLSQIVYKQIVKNLGTQIVYRQSVNILESQNVLEVNEPVLIVRPDDGPIGAKRVALYVLLMVTINMLDVNIYTLLHVSFVSMKHL
jgi:hypothetical protein